MERFYGAIREEVLRNEDFRLGVHLDPCSLKCVNDLRAFLDEAEAAVKHPVSAQLVACAKRRFAELVAKSRAKKR